MAMQASAAVAGSVGAASRPGEAAAATGPARTSADGRGESPAIKAERDAERAVTALYGTHYRPLVRLAAMLVGDVPTAEELVQDSFIALHASWRRPADSDGRAEPAQPSRHSRQLRAFREHDSPHECSEHARYRAWMLTMAGEVRAPGDPGQAGPDLVVDVAELVWEPVAD